MSGVRVEKLVSSEVARHVARTAARLFAKQGYDATSVRSIVEAAGVTKPTLYYHFGSKEGLAQALLNTPLSGLSRSLHEIAEAPGEPLSILERLFEAHFAFCREEPDRARFYYAICFGPLASGLAEELMRFGSRLDEPLVRAFHRLRGVGLVQADREADFVRACRGLITSAVIEFLYKPEMENDLGPALAHRLVGDLLWGFGHPGATGGG
ncbi:MAG: hypothetical protein NVSMB9_13100 [Isosphaeraceae bacterium]